jgi:hypothetical protein
MYFLQWRSMCDASTGVMVKFELHQTKELEQLKSFSKAMTPEDKLEDLEFAGPLLDAGYKEIPAHAQWILRITEDYHGTDRMLVADAGFGSVTAARLLYKVGIWCIMNIKGCHKLAPKAWCLSHLRDRGDTINLVNEEFGVPLLLSGHMDKKPMVLVATVGTSDNAVQALKRVRYRFKHDEGVMRRTYYLVHSVVHSMYRRFFNVVDVHNRSRHGVRDIAAVWQCMFYGTRLIMTIFHFVAVNAIKIFRQYHPGQRRETADGERDATDMNLMEQLALELVNNTIDEDAIARTRSTGRARDEPHERQPDGPHACMHVPELIPPGKWNSQQTCSYCRDRNIAKGVSSKQKGGRALTRYKCKICNVYLCPTNNAIKGSEPKPCLDDHRREVLRGDARLESRNRFDPEKPAGNRRGARGRSYRQNPRKHGGGETF